MDFSAVLPIDLPGAAIVAATPDYVWAALASAVATLALTLIFGARRTAATTRSTTRPAPGACEFLIHGAALQPTTEPARALLNGLGPARAGLAGLRNYLAADCPSIDADLDKLILYGVGFRHHCQRADGAAYTVKGEPRGAAAFLSIRPASREARALCDAEQDLRRALEEARFLRDVLDRAPVLAWSLSPDRQVTWANAAYRDRFAPPQADLPDHRIPDVFGHVLDEVPLTARAGDSRRRIAVPGSHDGEARWFEVSQSAGPGGETLAFALDSDNLVAAEASLRRFIETLTETFAHLPIGLAVFDKNRRLGLFNPALTDLVKIDAVWLAARPSLRDFLERLRETRQMPEQKDFTSWRRKLGELEEGARDGTYEENWVLPSGKIFRVTGRPHPQGALAFLFEDISTAILIERKYRSELELSQATLDRMAEAVAVFDTSGMLVFVNSAFEAMWSLDPMESLDSPDIGDIIQHWAQRCRPSSVWCRLREFATRAEARATWVDAIETRDGRLLQMLVAPLPDASALVVFRNLNEERAALTEARVILDARQAHREHDAPIEGPAQALIASPGRAKVDLLAAPTPEPAAGTGSTDAFRAPSAAAQGPSDGSPRSRASGEIARDPLEGRGPAAGLAALLEARGLTFELAGEAAIDTAGRRRAVWALALAAADMAAPGAVVRIDAVSGAESFVLTANLSDPASAGRIEGVSQALARWIVASLGGEIVIKSDADGRLVSLCATLPPSADPATASHRALTA